MTQIDITDRAAKYIEKLSERADNEKIAIAEALATVSEATASIEDNDEFRNLCSVLGHYHRLLTLITD